MPSGTYFVNIQFNVSVFGVGFVDFSNSFHAFVEVADGVTFSEVTGLLPLGPPVSSVPLPDTYALMVGGLGLLGFVARSKKQQAAY